ncbi:LPS export ABC transporter ATP-binding protein [Ostreibacterium oceani]|uniref:Lipopolysaccharide export system ATP-binding protein LptB n=1 Tax=Ostreibacterium oceani TaxID=2654998 RepID=A0A6N7EUA7_9GAMM|nr:LPS export ABC transporter ATP-binding protein [Ostreibacterium oceani]MPV86364.1 LPS export ABC transporter ATP-binding protein [Ostreibacterium oceani]
MAELRVDNISKSYNKRTVVNSASFSVLTGQVVGLLGPNGAGKTTSFYMTVGLIRPDAGRIMLNDTQITTYSMHKRARLGIGYLPQEASIFRKMSVFDNVFCVLQMQNMAKKTATDNTMQLLEELSITHIKDELGLSLSGGERRRVEIARSLATNPQFILLDEPFAGVDPISIQEIKNIILHLKQRNIGVLITDHNVRETLQICDRAYIMSEGMVIAEGSASDILANQQVRDVYLGHDFSI